MLGLLRDLGAFLVKALWPTHCEDPVEVLRWRQSVAVFLMMIIAIMLGSFLWAQGIIPGLSGVALASDVEKSAKSDDLQRISREISERQTRLETQQISLSVNIVRQSLKQALNERCVALNRQNQDALTAANNDIEMFSDQYQDLMHRAYTIEPCDVLLIKDQSHH